MRFLDPEELSLMVEKIVSQQSLRRENIILRKVLKRGYTFRDLVSKAPAMQLTGVDLAEVSLATYAGKRKVLNIFPSIDTPTCATSNPPAWAIPPVPGLRHPRCARA